MAGYVPVRIGGGEGGGQAAFGVGAEGGEEGDGGAGKGGGGGGVRFGGRGGHFGFLGDEIGGWGWDAEVRLSACEIFLSRVADIRALY